MYGFDQFRQVARGLATAARAGRLRRYTISVLSVVAATLVTRAAEPLFGGKAPLTFFTAAVILAASFGLGPGLVATALSVASVLLLFREIFALVLLHSSLTLFVVIGVSISAMMGRLHKANVSLRRAHRKLEAANQQLSEHARALVQSNDELSRFAYSIAHDLSTPVRSIAALTDLLVQRNESRMDASSRECAALISDKAVRIQAMIKGLLDYAAAVDKTGAPVSADARLAAQKALLDLESVIAASGAEITIDPLPVVAAAEAQVVQVFTNLIGNGIKYSHRARVPRIHISAAGQGDEVTFCVRDNGIGIDMQYSATIFAMFQRLHGDAYEGSGIGLALCKSIVENRGGRIWLESQLGSGSSFYFTLRRAGSAPNRPNKAAPPPRTMTASV